MITNVVFVDKLNANDQDRDLIERTKKEMIIACQANNIKHATYPTEIELWKTLLVSLGGDGTALFTMRIGAETNNPVMAINLGHLGYLASYSNSSMGDHYNTIDDFRDIISSNPRKNWREERQLLQGNLDNAAYTKDTFLAVNEYHIAPQMTGVMISAKIYVDGHVVGKQRGDGILISSTTGSTAYAMSAGGPIMHPHLAAMQISFVAPQSMNARPFIVPSSSEVKVEITPLDTTPLVIRADGQIKAVLCPAVNTLTITQYKNTVTMWHSNKWSFYSNLAEKVGWWKEEDNGWW